MTGRRHRLHSEEHPPTARRRRAARRVANRRKANRRLENFGRINWDLYEHRALWDMVHSADVGRMGQRTHDWQVLAREVDEATRRVHGLVDRLVDSWRGPSSVAAAASVTRLTQWAADASERAYRVGSGLDAYTSAVQEAARRMPEPVHPTAEKWFRDGYDVTTLDGPQGAYMLDQLLDEHMPSKQEQRRAKAEAVRVMREYEDASRSVHDGLPTFDTAPGGTDIRPDHRPERVGPDDRAPQPPREPEPPRRPPHERLPGPVPTPEPAPEPAPGGRPGDTTTLAGAGGPTGFGIPGLPGGTAVPGGYAAGPNGGLGAPGGFGPIGSGGSSGVIGAVPGGAAARGGVVQARQGGPQGFGMFPPTAQPGREEDVEHRNRYDNGLDLLDDLPPAFPPVLGE
ncbi:hypothetical protein GCM10009660_48980 [Catellatospora bangladeshensis]